MRTLRAYNSGPSLLLGGNVKLHTPSQGISIHHFQTGNNRWLWSCPKHLFHYLTLKHPICPQKALKSTSAALSLCFSTSRKHSRMCWQGVHCLFAPDMQAGVLGRPQKGQGRRESWGHNNHVVDVMQITISCERVQRASAPADTGRHGQARADAPCGQASHSCLPPCRALGHLGRDAAAGKTLDYLPFA